MRTLVLMVAILLLVPTLRAQQVETKEKLSLSCTARNHRKFNYAE